MFSIGEIARIVGGSIVGTGTPIPCGFSADSRRIAPGDLFFALSGARVDGHAFVADAARRGACGAVVSRQASDLPSTLSLVVVDDVGRALRAVAQAWRARFSTPIVAITGSNGKTTTKALLSHLAGGTFRTYAAPENYNTEIGLPLALLAMPSDAELGVFELGADRPGDIEVLAKLLEPSTAIVTSVGPSHLESFGTAAAVADEKWSLVHLLKPPGHAFVNADSPELRARAAEPRPGLVEVGISHGTVRGRVVSAVPRLVVDLADPSLTLETALVGEQNATNLILAALCAIHLGVAPSEIEARARDFRPVPHRMELRRARFGALIDDVYNANPASMVAALRALSSFEGAPSQRAVIFGDMLGLGDCSASLHEEVAQAALGLPIGLLYPVGERARAAFAATGDGRVCILAREAIAGDLVARWDRETTATVLVKGSRGMALETLADEILRLAPYDV